MRRFEFPPSLNRSRFALLGAAAIVIATVGSAIASDPFLPEFKKDGQGRPIKIKDADRAKFDEYIECAFCTLPGNYGKKLAHCKGTAGTVGLYEINPLPFHWKHGAPPKRMDAPAFTPVATDKQIAACQLCIAVDLKQLCKWHKESQEGDNDWLKAWRQRQMKSIFRHEAVHWLQDSTWTCWKIPNGDLFNCPWDGEGSTKGKNGNPGGDETDEGYKADKKARKLYDKFAKTRSELTELEATLVGDLGKGCLDGTNNQLNKTWGGYFLEAPKEKAISRVECYCKRLNECKTKLFEMAGKIKKDCPDTKPYKKVRAFAKSLCDNKKKMCKDIADMAACKAKTKATWMKKYCP